MVLPVITWRFVLFYSKQIPDAFGIIGTTKIMRDFARVLNSVPKELPEIVYLAFLDNLYI